MNIVRTIWIDVVPQNNIPITGDIPMPYTMVEESFNYTKFLLIIYVIGLGIMLLRLMVQSFSIANLVSKGRTSKKGTIKIVETEVDVSPCSFFNRIIYNPNNIEAASLPAILAHEKCHVRQFHSIDVLLANLLVIFQWFNPLAWWYRSVVQQNLEYLADAQAQQTEITKKGYQYVLLKSQVGNHLFSLVNPFFNSSISSIKKRIVMLKKEKSNRKKAWKYGLMLPLLAIFIMVFQTDTIAQVRVSEQHPIEIPRAENYSIGKNTSDAEIIEIKSAIEQKGGQFTYTLKRNASGEITDLQLEIKNNGTGHFKSDSPFVRCYFGTLHEGGVYLGDNRESFEKFKKRMEEARNESGETRSTPIIPDSISGKPIVTGVASDIKPSAKTDEISQTLHKDSVTGKTTGYTLKVPGKEPLEVRYGMKALGPTLNYAAPDHVKSMNNAWSNKLAVLRYGLNTTKSNSKTFQNDITKTSKNLQSTLVIHDSITGLPIVTGVASGIKLGVQDKRPLIILDGKEITYAALNLISPNQIESMNVWKSAQALSMYGEKAADGAIEIHTKNSKYKPVTYDKERSGDFPHGVTIRSNVYKGDNPPLYIIDGKEAPKATFEKLEPTNIKEIRVLKGEKAIEKYGQKAKNGAIEIETKVNKWKVGFGKAPANSEKISYSDFFRQMQKDNPDAANINLNRALIIIDDKEASLKELDKIKVGEIKAAMTVADGKAAIAKYGNKAKHGVIVLTTKKAKN
tara:strand:- start:43594 stop:45810 length:2217 start_codon:yes stop_codon:yes gene_type:complete